MGIWLWLTVALALLGAFALVAWLAWRRSDPAAREIVRRIARLSLADKLRLARALAADRRIPWPVRLLPPALVLYLALPLDLVPDFIPILGQLDDLLLLGLGLALIFRFAPRAALEDDLARLGSDRI